MSKKDSTDIAVRSVKKSKLKEVWHQFKKNKGAMIGVVIVILLVLLTLFSDVIWNYETDVIAMHPADRLIKPSWEHPFGTDSMGRDMVARIGYGTRYSLIIGIFAVAISVVFGSFLGAIAGYYGGIAETITMRIVEIFLMIPSILLIIMVMAIAGTSLMNLMIAMGITTIPYFARNARAAVLTVRGNEYVEAARAVGAKDLSIIFGHVFPNSFSPILVQATTRVAQCIVQAASFSFLGLGVPPPTPEWGTLLSDSRAYMRTDAYLTFFPGLAIMVLVLSINLIGDGLRDALDPKLKR
ncbi:MAG: ABC transporter permease [Oscillospiraceae bacterium]